MRKIMIMLMMLVVTAVTASAELLFYKAKYTDEYGNVQTVRYVLSTETATDTESSMYVYKHYRSIMIAEEIIDEDSDAKDLAIVNKLDKQGYLYAQPEYYYPTMFVKVEGKWRKLYNKTGERK